MLGLIRSETTNLSGSSVELIGSTTFVSKLQSVFANVEIDWEEPITQILGDLTGHELSRSAQTGAAWIKDRTQTANRLISEYLTEELRGAAGKQELEGFYQEVDQLRLAADRFGARLERLKKQINSLL